MKECPQCGTQVADEAKYCSQCRADFAHIEAAADAEGAEARAEGDRAVRHFLLFVFAVMLALAVVTLGIVKLT